MIKVLHIFFSQLWLRKSRLLLYVPLFIIAVTCLQLQPFFFKFIVDAAELGNTASLQNFAILYVIILAIGHCIENIEHYILGMYLGKIQDDVIEKVMKALRNMDHYFHTSKSSGGLISLVRRGDGSLYGFGWTILNRIGGVIVQTLTALITFLFLAPSAFYILLSAICILAFILYPILRHNLAARKSLAKTEDALSSSVVDNLIAFENVKIFGKELHEGERTASLLSKRYAAGSKYLFTFQEINFSFVGVMIIAISSIIYFSLSDLQSGVITTGTFILILTFITKNFYSLWEVIYNLRDLLKSYSDIQAYFDLLDLKPSIQESAQSIYLEDVKGSVNIENVSFQYSASSNNVLNQVDLQIHPGETIAFVGKSGGGKTTLAKLIMRFYDPTAGLILLDGINIRQLSLDTLRKHIGIVPQDPVLFNNTIAYNIGYPSENSTLEQIKDAAERACLSDFIESLPDQYDTVVGERGIKLSGGQRQRLAIARAFVHNPCIIIFDEATSQLDSENERLISDAMNELKKNKTMIVIAHRLSTIMHSDRIVVFEDGNIIEIGSHAELLNKQSGLYNRLWNMQTNGLIT